MKRHTNIIITAVASLLIVTLAGREFIKNHKKESNDKSSTNVSENTCEDIPDTSISDTSISDTCVAAGQILQGRLYTPQRKSAIYTCTTRRL